MYQHRFSVSGPAIGSARKITDYRGNVQYGGDLRAFAGNLVNIAKPMVVSVLKNPEVQKKVSDLIAQGASHVANKLEEPEDPAPSKRLSPKGQNLLNSLLGKGIPKPKKISKASQSKLNSLLDQGIPKKIRKSSQSKLDNLLGIKSI